MDIGRLHHYDYPHSAVDLRVLPVLPALVSCLLTPLPTPHPQCNPAAAGPTIALGLYQPSPRTASNLTVSTVALRLIPSARTHRQPQA
ncbi:hypothetical protein V8D89_005254 [Ganoderma adspersum]